MHGIVEASKHFNLQMTMQVIGNIPPAIAIVLSSGWLNEYEDTQIYSSKFNYDNKIS